MLLLAGAGLIQTAWPPAADGSCEADGVPPRFLANGWCAAAADYFWLRANVAWERRDPAATDAFVRAAVGLAPEVDYFRINAARILAFDLPTWRIPVSAPAAVHARARREHAARALALLGERKQPSAAVLIEMGRLWHQVMGDPGRAAECYGRAAARPGAPYFAGRLCVEMLVQAGRPDDARAWLACWLERLPSDDPAAQRAQLEARLAELEAYAGERRQPVGRDDAF